MKKMKVVTVEYETKDHVVWKAGVLAFSIKDANETIIKNVPNYDRPISTGMTREIDIISSGVMKSLVDKYLPSKDKTQPDKVEETPKVEETQLYICPFCDKPYKTKKTLLTHIKKSHK